MKKTLFSLALLFAALTAFSSFTTHTYPAQPVALIPQCAEAQGQNTAQQKRYALYGVAFYNLENLFDTLHDAGKNDYEYLPDGTNKWGKMKYEAKLHNMARVLSELCTDKLPAGPAVVGVSEVENHHVMEDLLKQPALKNRGWKYVDYPGVDRRGVECAFFYNPRLFTLQNSMIVPYYYAPDGKIDNPLVGFYTDADGKVRAYNDLKGDTTHITRGFLVMEGLMAGEKMFFIVVHWPSRGAGDEIRQRAGFQVRKLTDALLQQEPQAKIMVMGDMNDDPNNKSMTHRLGCRAEQKDVKQAGDFYNPWYNTLYKTGQGTLMYNGQWNLFDQIVMNGNLIGKDRSTLKFYQHAIFMRDYLFQQEGRYKGNPLRTHAGGVWLNGYSDHLPTQVYLIKEVGNGK